MFEKEVVLSFWLQGLGASFDYMRFFHYSKLNRKSKLTQAEIYMK